MTTIESAMRALTTKAALALMLALGLATAPGFAAESAAPAATAHEGEGGHGAEGVDWQAWKAGNEITNVASLQRGAANFVNYCQGCHSLKYMRYERMAKDLEITPELLADKLIATGAKPTDYMLSTFPAADGEAWFGRAPPDLSLTARAKGVDYIYRFLKGFYVDESRTIGTNNLALPGAAMPAVLSDLEGVKRAVFHQGGVAGGEHGGGPRVERFEQVSPGVMSAAEFDGFVRDTTNFLDYASEPAQAQRVHLGIWVVLFLLVFTWFAYLLKQEYWKDVH
jgi:ubiquinol-cytochrome c reductase cytochrome c1 subunit